MGLPNESIAAGCGITATTLYQWLKDAKEAAPGTLVAEFSEAIRAGAAAGERKLVANLQRNAENGSDRASSWLLTHSPKYREKWSDAAATKRELQRAMGVVVDVIRQSAASLDIQRDILLALQAQGLAGDQQIEE